MRLFVLLTTLLLALPAEARATDFDATSVDVSFHISHPAKEYDANLLPGGGTAMLSFDPEDMSTLRLTTSFKVEMFNSDNTRRDSHMLETLEGFVYPTIDWKVTNVSGISGPVKAGRYSIEAEGPLTLHGVTKELKIPVELSIDDAGMVTATSGFVVMLEDYAIERPTLLFVPIANDVPIQVRMAFDGAGKFEFPGPVDEASEASGESSAAAEKAPASGTEEAPASAGEAE